MAKHRILTDETGEKIVKALNIIAQNGISHQSMDWQKVRTLIANGVGESAFAIGTQLIEKWTDTAYFPVRRRVNRYLHNLSE